MKRILLTLTIFFHSLISISQVSNEDLKKVDKIIYSYHSISSIEELAKRIDYDFTSEIEKARAIYTWLALNINYTKFNTNLIYIPEVFVVFDNNDFERRLKINKNKVTNKAFITKKGVCKEYAYLFEKICNLINIKNELIFGYTKTSNPQIGIIPSQKNHVWNAVYIEDKWILIDVTYGSGYLYKDIWQRHFNDSYFNISKENLKLTHYPSDKYWSTFIKQNSLIDFCAQPIISSGFTKNNISTFSPKNGEIKIDNNKKIKLQFKDLPYTTKVYYKYENNKYITKANKSNYNSITSIKLPKPSKNSSLKIYFDNELALEYNVVVEK